MDRHRRCEPGDRQHAPSAGVGDDRARPLKLALFARRRRHRRGHGCFRRSQFKAHVYVHGCRSVPRERHGAWRDVRDDGEVQHHVGGEVRDAPGNRRGHGAYVHVHKHARQVRQYRNRDFQPSLHRGDLRRVVYDRVHQAGFGFRRLRRPGGFARRRGGVEPLVFRSRRFAAGVNRGRHSGEREHRGDLGRDQGRRFIGQVDGNRDHPNRPTRRPPAVHGRARRCRQEREQKPAPVRSAARCSE
mmetsp:Transcript_917/g.3503  ORF Transcript_917/g.3503 Transcript_917/m.3503 type:complete len:244 (+) Transcript_917:5260-5991(+)